VVEQNEIITTTPQHPFYVTQRASLEVLEKRNLSKALENLSQKWIPASDLEIGDTVLTSSGQTGTVTLVRTFEKTQEMYNLEVARAGTFSVSSRGWVVHNSRDELNQRLLEAIESESPYRTRVDPNFPGQPNPAYSVDTSKFNPSGATSTANGGLRDYRQFWPEWAEMRPETLSPTNKFLAENAGRPTGNVDANGRPTRYPAPRVDPTWVEHFPEHADHLDDGLIHHHVDGGRHAVPVPSETHPGSGGPFHCPDKS
jgi:hypothetical protein